MAQIKDLLRQKRHKELWQMCCGFLDLSIDQFMNIQKRLLLEQIELLKVSELGRKVMRNAMPQTIEEFREQVPMTTYKDYCPELLEKRTDCLPSKAVHWAHTSGKSGEYPFKWVPISERAWEEMGPVLCAARIFASSKNRGEIKIKPHARILYATAPAPYTTGIMAARMKEEFGYQYFPSLDESEQITFMERLEKGFWQALEDGMDGFYGLPTALVAIGERFKSGARNIKLGPLLRKPKTMLRLIRGKIKSRLAGRDYMLPKDLWSIRGMACGGTDSFIFREKIYDMWGVRPLDVYAGTESIMVAMQTWDYKGMTFVPNFNFFEFIPEEEHMKWQADRLYKPKTVLLNEVEAGKVYEIVITNFHGGAMVRYRAGDMVRIITIRNEELGIDIPQMAFERRADDLIDLGLIRLTEKVIWQAIENTAIPYRDWTARKEIMEGNPALHLYIELKDDYIASEKGIATAVYTQIKKLDDGFIHYDLSSMEKLIGFKPVEVTILKPGSFDNYMAHRQAEGADLAHLKPPHINPTDSILNVLQASKPQVVTEEKEIRTRTRVS